MLSPMAKVALSPDQLESMERDGFVVLERVFSAQDMDQLDQALEPFFQKNQAWVADAGGTSGISRTGEIAFESHIAEHSPAVREFVRREEFVSLGQQLLGPDVDLYWNQIVYKCPETPRDFPWHQDDAYTPVSPSPYLTLWLAVSDATLENGCISVLPGSHREGLQPHEKTPLGLACHSSDDPDQGIAVPVPAGSMIVFWSLTMHKSGPNTSDVMRKAYIVQLCKGGTVYAESGDPVPVEVKVARG